ncbi:hypothetical protein [Halorarum halobium]|uniref:hypothetical protein n=1 Tax=Halorarum halobium TaxID=3075121 RepID=UPI0028A9C07D|nr:hypothetical protein [Halobaculum sp. XH14]
MGAEDLPPDRANRIADAVEDVERNVTSRRGFQHVSRDAYTDPDEQDRRDVIERKFEKLTEATLEQYRLYTGKSRSSQSTPRARR